MNLRVKLAGFDLDNRQLKFSDDQHLSYIREHLWIITRILSHFLWIPHTLIPIQNPGFKSILECDVSQTYPESLNRTTYTSPPQCAPSLILFAQC